MESAHLLQGMQMVTFSLSREEYGMQNYLGEGN